VLINTTTILSGMGVAVGVSPTPYAMFESSNQDAPLAEIGGRNVGETPTSYTMFGCSNKSSKSDLLD